MDTGQVVREQAQSSLARDIALGHLSLSFLLDQVATGVGGWRGRDALLLMAINQANIAPLTREHTAREHYGSLEAPAPDEERRAVSVSAIAGSLGLPFETVRRRIKHLEEQGACATAGHGVIVPESFLASPAYLQSVVHAHQGLRAFYREVEALGLVGDLPPSTFSVGDVVPVRAAARLLSDYILRASENLMTEAGDVVSALVLLGVLCASTAEPPGERASSISTLAARLQLPDETVRRHAAQVVDKGLCLRVPRGLVVTREMLGRPAWAGFFHQNSANVHRLFVGLAERGVVDAWNHAAR